MVGGVEIFGDNERGFGAKKSANFWLALNLAIALFGCNAFCGFYFCPILVPYLHIAVILGESEVCF